MLAVGFISSRDVLLREIEVEYTFGTKTEPNVRNINISGSGRSEITCLQSPLSLILCCIFI